MAVRTTRGFRNAALDGGVKAALVNAVLYIFGGSGIPTSAESAVNTGTNPILLTISSINWGTPTNGALSKTGTLSATSVAGTPLFYRLCDNGDDGISADPGDQSTVRCQGDVGVDLILNNATFSGTTETIDHINLILPESIFG